MLQVDFQRKPYQLAPASHYHVAMQRLSPTGTFIHELPCLRKTYLFLGIITTVQSGYRMAALLTARNMY